MKIPFYLAMTPAEFLTCTVLPEKVAWMAGHFSPGGDGLCNLPDRLPPDSLLIIDDSWPYQGHDPQKIIATLADAFSQLKPQAVLLDFQRSGIPSVQALANDIVSQLPCTVAVSSCYAENLDCPVFLPPGPLDQPLSQYLKPYQGREIWLDAAPTCGQVVVTAVDSTYTPLSGILASGRHFDHALYCHYDTKIEDQRILFTLTRICSDLLPWLQEAENLGVSCAVGLYQEVHGLS